MIGIVAISNNGVIGIGNDLPWRIPQDLKHFRETTSGHAVLMGRKTWESIPQKIRPLPNRQNLVLTEGKVWDYSAQGRTWIADSLPAFLDGCREWYGSQKLYCIGGAATFSFCRPWINEWIVTWVDATIAHQDAVIMPPEWLQGFAPMPPHRLIAKEGQSPSAVINRWVRDER